MLDDAMKRYFYLSNIIVVLVCNWKEEVQIEI